jgi:ATP-dependent RNA helicase DDX52/ROK1
MDIVKLLSTSTKKTHKPTSVTGPNSKLPSAGSASNPQLFHDPIPELQGTKRKRNGVDIWGEDAPYLGEELNYFASKAKGRIGDGENKVEQGRMPTAREALSSGTTPKLLDETDCRRLLLSHRLKVTLLPIGDSPISTKAKKSKTQSNENAKVDKNEFKRLYPQPLQAFEELQTTYGISKRLGENLVQQGYKIPTEVQLGTLPLLLRPDIALSTTSEGRKLLGGQSDVDLLVVAPTGSGKTLAFLIPIIQRIIQRRRGAKPREGHCLEAIVMAPTKELASQLVNEGRKLAIGTGINVVGMQKGMKVLGNTSDSLNDNVYLSGDETDNSEEDEEEQDENDMATAERKTSGESRQPATKTDILVTTPLSLLNTLTTKSGKVSCLPAVRHLVLDEADVLLDPLFRDQTLGIWEACINPTLHVTLWSATMGSNIESLVSSTIQNQRSRLNLPNTTPLVRLVVGLKDSAIPNISHRLIYTATEPGKLLALRQLLHPASSGTKPLCPPFLIFTQTIPRAVALHSELLYDIPAAAGGSSRLAVLHSDLSLTARSAIMSRFRAGEIWILITTDILSRGVDFRGVNGVVNYDIPNSSASYIHRVGRTGRAGRDGGVAVTFYTKEDVPYVKNVANVIAASERQAAGGKESCPERQAGSGESLPKWLLDALPKTSKADKKKLKLRGVEARRAKGMNRKGKRETKISTKSGFERRLENKRKGAIEGSRKRFYEAKNERDCVGPETEDSSEWSGIED